MSFSAADKISRKKLRICIYVPIRSGREKGINKLYRTLLTKKRFLSLYGVVQLSWLCQYFITISKQNIIFHLCFSTKKRLYIK